MLCAISMRLASCDQNVVALYNTYPQRHFQQTCTGSKHLAQLNTKKECQNYHTLGLVPPLPNTSRVDRGRVGKHLCRSWTDAQVQPCAKRNFCRCLPQCSLTTYVYTRKVVWSLSLSCLVAGISIEALRFDHHLKQTVSRLSFGYVAARTRKSIVQRRRTAPDIPCNHFMFPNPDLNRVGILLFLYDPRPIYQCHNLKTVTRSRAHLDHFLASSMAHCTAS